MRVAPFVSAVLVACSAVSASCRAPSSSERAGAIREPIVGGVDSTADDDQVVLILTHVPAKDTPQGAFYLNCTGTLLSPSVVLTARHCVSESTMGTFTCNEDGTHGTGLGGHLQDDFVPADTTIWIGPELPETVDPTTFPGKAASYVHGPETILCNADVALIVLEAPIAGAKIAPVRLEGDVKLDEALTVVGWGATETSYIPPARQRRDDVTVTAVGPSSVQYPGGMLADKEFLASESVCFGDSGGPAFDATTGAVVGVVSRGPNGGIMTDGSGCVGTQHTFMKTSGFKDLIDQAFATAGGEPWIEGQSPPGEGGGGGGAGGGGGGDASGGGGADATGGAGGDGEDDGSGCTVMPARSAPLPIFVALALALAACRRRGARTR